MTAADESELIARARAGDETAFGELVGRYKDRLYGIASSVCATMPSEADDVAQETFISALKGISSFKANSAFSTWLYRIAANNCWQRLRGAKNRRQSALPEDDSLHPTQPSASESAVKNELSRAVSVALFKLPSEYRMAVTLCDIEGLPNSSAAAKMRISVAALKSRLHRARLMLKKQLAGFNHV